MEYVIAICGFVGGWLLLAGPVWQAAIELREEEIDRDAIEAVRSAAPLRPRLSTWWWLLPPVAYIKQYRESRAARQAFHDALTPEQLEQAVNFFNKANGWLIVAIGGLLIAAKETWELIALLDWPVWVFWVLVLVMAVLAVANAVVRLVNTRNTLNPVQPRARKR